MKRPLFLLFLLLAWPALGQPILRHWVTTNQYNSTAVGAIVTNNDVNSRTIVSHGNTFGGALFQWWDSAQGQYISATPGNLSLTLTEPLGPLTLIAGNLTAQNGGNITTSGSGQFIGPSAVISNNGVSTTISSNNITMSGSTPALLTIGSTTNAQFGGANGALGVGLPVPAGGGEATNSQSITAPIWTFDGTNGIKTQVGPGGSIGVGTNPAALGPGSLVVTGQVIASTSGKGFVGDGSALSNLPASNPLSSVPLTFSSSGNRACSSGTLSVFPLNMGQVGGFTMNAANERQNQIPMPFKGYFSNCIGLVFNQGTDQPFPSTTNIYLRLNTNAVDAGILMSLTGDGSTKLMWSGATAIHCPSNCTVTVTMSNNQATAATINNNWILRYFPEP